MRSVSETFVYLGEQPLLWLFLTLLAYAFGDWCQRAAGRSALLNPVAIASLLLGSLLLVTETSYDQYFGGAQFIHFLLGPAIVGLAIPVMENLPGIWRPRYPMVVALLLGALAGAASAIGLGLLFGLPLDTVASIAPKSVTAPIAMGIAEQLGGIASIAAVVAVLTGITGAVIATPLFNRLGYRDWRARGFAVGAACHGIGTAHAFQVNKIAGTYATMGMALNGILSALLVPLLFTLMAG